MRTSITVAIITGLMLLPVGASADTARFYSTGTQFDDGGCTGRRLFTRFVGANFSSATAVLSGFSMTYRAPDRPTKRETVQITSQAYNRSTGNVVVGLDVCHHDFNSDDPFDWYVFFTLIGQS